MHIRSSCNATDCGDCTHCTQSSVDREFAVQQQNKMSSPLPATAQSANLKSQTKRKQVHRKQKPIDNEYLDGIDEPLNLFFGFDWIVFFFTHKPFPGMPSTKVCLQDRKCCSFRLEGISKKLTKRKCCRFFCSGV